MKRAPLKMAFDLSAKSKWWEQKIDGFLLFGRTDNLNENNECIAIFQYKSIVDNHFCFVEWNVQD